MWVGLATTSSTGTPADQIEAALTQALQHDAHCAPAWAQLALAALAQGFKDEASVHVRHALDLGLDDTGVLRRLAAACGAAGMQEAEQACLMRSDGALAAAHGVAAAGGSHANSCGPASPGCGTPQDLQGNQALPAMALAPNLIAAS